MEVSSREDAVRARIEAQGGDGTERCELVLRENSHLVPLLLLQANRRAGGREGDAAARIIKRGNHGV